MLLLQELAPLPLRCSVVIARSLFRLRLTPRSSGPGMLRETPAMLYDG